MSLCNLSGECRLIIQTRLDNLYLYKIAAHFYSGEESCGSLISGGLCKCSIRSGSTETPSTKALVQIERHTDEEQAQAAGSCHPCHHQMHHLVASKTIHLAKSHIINPTGNDSGAIPGTAREGQRGRAENRGQKPPQIRRYPTQQERWMGRCSAV